MKDTFDFSEWLSENPEFNPNYKQQESNTSFKALSQMVRAHFESYFDRIEVDEISHLEKQHRAIIGDDEARQYFISEIREWLREKGIFIREFPYGETLEEALFQDIFGWGPLTPFFSNDSQTAIVSDTEVWFDIDGVPVKQPGFENIERVNELIRALLMRKPESKINEQMPELELEMHDGTRVAMVIPPRGRHIYIEFRKFIVKNFSLEKHASLGTIDPDDIPMHEALARTLPNTIFAGPVRSGKTTMLKTYYALRDPKLVAAVTEQHFEVQLKRDFPDRLVFEFQANERQLEQVTRRVLRFYHDFILVPEVRSIEAEAALMSCEKGARGMMMSYHNTYVQNIPEELARFVLNSFPNRNFENEVLRVGKNIDIVITMEPHTNKKFKRVTSISEIQYHPEQRKVTANLLAKWDREKDCWYYHNGLSNWLILEMYKANSDETKKLIEFLNARSSVRPINGQTTYVCYQSQL